MKSLRIAVLSPIHWRTPPRSQGAWELVASNITEELVRRGHDVTLYASADSVTKAKLKSIAPHPLLEPSGAQLESKVYGYLHAALPFEDADQFDILHNHYDGYPLTMSRLVKLPVITTVHGFSSPQISTIYRKYAETHYVSISQADRKYCPDMNWIATIHHGIDMTNLPFNPETEEYYVFLGRLHPTKGTDVAIRAAKAAGVKLKIGAYLDQDDPLAVKYWEEKIKPHIDDKQIIYLGEVAEDKKGALLGKAKALIAPIQWDEPFGLVFIEAMACGTPVIAYSRGSVPELVVDGVNGFNVPPDDFETLVSTLARADTIDRRGVRRYAEEHFSIGKMVDHYEAAYAKILGL